MYAETKDPEIIILNPRMANLFLLKNNLEDQRTKKPRLINKYAKKMREGFFRTAQIAVAELDYDGGEEVLMNGQHCCEAVIQTNKTVRATLESYICYTPKDSADLYAQFDTEGGRTMGDLIQVRLRALKLNWPKKVGNAIVAAAVKENGASDWSKSDRVELLEEYLDEGHFINFILNSGIPTDVRSKTKQIKHLKRAPVIRAMFVTWRKCHRDAEIFWARVRDGEGLLRKMPSYKLREWLREANYTHGMRSMDRGQDIVTPHEMLYKCIVGWNAFRSGKVTALKYFSAKPVPRAL